MVAAAAAAASAVVAAAAASAVVASVDSHLEGVDGVLQDPGLSLTENHICKPERVPQHFLPLATVLEALQHLRPG